MTSVASFYSTVINEVIDSLKPQFNEEGIDPAVLNDLKELWEKKIKDSGALEQTKSTVQSAAHFSTVMHQQHQSQQLDGSVQRGGITRLTNIGNPTSRLIKPSGQGSLMADPSCFGGGATTTTTSATRVTVPLLVQPANTAGFRSASSSFAGAFSRPNALDNRRELCLPNHHQHHHQCRLPSEYLFSQWLKPDNSGNRLRHIIDNNINKPATSSSSAAVTKQQPPIGFRNNIPMVINAGHQHGLAVFSQYHNIIDPNHGAQIMTDNGVVNLRKNQVDGADDGSSEDEEGDFVNVSEVDPQSVRPPMSNVPATPAIFKKETKEDESDEEFVEEEIENINQANLSVKNEESDDENDDDEDEAEEAQNEEEPLNSEDDISDDDPERIFETDNVIVCQYEKVNRTRNKWKLNFVSGIANLHGKDSVFHKAVGEAEW